MTELDWKINPQAINDLAQPDVLRIEIDRLRAENGRLSMENDSLRAIKGRGEIDRLRTENAELREVLTECADDLQTELQYRYGYPSIHPAMQRKFDRDMAPVERARALLARTAKD